MEFIPLFKKFFFIVKYLQEQKMHGFLLCGTGIYLSTRDFFHTGQ